jgi:hypothetical protein
MKFVLKTLSFKIDQDYMVTASVRSTLMIAQKTAVVAIFLGLMCHKESLTAIKSYARF